MFKVDSYYLFLLSAFFLNNANVRLFPSNGSQAFNQYSEDSSKSTNVFANTNNNTTSSVVLDTQQQQVINIQQTNPAPLRSSVIPQSYNWHFNSFTNTFIPSFMLSSWNDNNAIGIFNNNNFSLPITDNSENSNNASATTNNSLSPSVVPDMQWQQVDNQTNDVTVTAQSTQSSPFSTHQQRESSVDTSSLFPIDSNIMPQPYNWCNSSTNTLDACSFEESQYIQNAHFFMNGQEALCNSDYNSTTNILNSNNLSPFILHDSKNSNDASSTTNKSTSLPIRDESIPSTITDTSSTTNSNNALPLLEHDSENSNEVSTTTNNCLSPPVIPHTRLQKVEKMEEDEDHTSIKNKKQKKKKKKQKNKKGRSKAKKKKNKKSYLCNICDKSLGSNRTLKDHIQRHSEERPFKCNICNKGFKTQGDKSTHLYTHRKEKPYQCKLCLKCFTRRENLKNHMRTHTGEKPFKCHLCQKGLASKISLKNHLNKHSGKKPYSCEECGKNFRQKNSFDRHKKQHKGEKNYKCSQCKKAYTTREGLKQHIKTHSRPKPFTCEYCDAVFAHKSEYNDHMRYEESKDEHLKCHRCKKVYASQRCFTKHNKNVHEQK